MDTTNTLGGTSPRRSSSGSNQLHTLTSASQPTLRPALGKEEIQSGTAYGLYPSFPSSAKPQNMPMPTPPTSESTPHVSTTLERDNTSTLGSASPRRSSSGNQLHTPAGAGQPADPSPALGREATQGSSAYAYADFPWTSEPQNMSMPELSTPESTPHLSRTFEADSKSARRNRLQKVSNPTLAVTGQPVARLHPGSGREEIQGGSAHGNASFPQAAEPQKRPLVPMPMPSAQSRPHLSRRFSEYTAMLLALDDISQMSNLFIKVCVWILLAGFLVLPATFAKLQNMSDSTSNTSGAESDVISHLRHVPLFVIGCVCGGIGVLGMCWFWYRWHANYIWISNNIFMPGALNALQGVIATLSSNYGQNNKLVFTGSSKWTLIATGGLTVVCAVLFIFYKFIMLRNVQKKHDVEHGERRAGTHGEGAGF